MDTYRDRDPFPVAAFLMGLGLGGLFDGIVLHQVLQWHPMVSTPVPPDTLANLEQSTLADLVAADIISMAQHASPASSGHMLLTRTYSRMRGASPISSARTGSCGGPTRS